MGNKKIINIFNMSKVINDMKTNLILQKKFVLFLQYERI